MWYSRRHKAAFVHIFKTGGTSIRTALMPHADPPGMEWFYHAPAHAMAKVFRDWDRLYSFAVVRNPWDWTLSHYLWILQRRDINGVPHELEPQVREYGDFATYVARGLEGRELPFWAESQLGYIAEYGGSRILVSEVLRFERLEEGWDRVQKRLGIRAPLGRENKTRRNADYRTYYDDTTAEIVGRHYRRDCEIFDYSF